MNLDVLRAQAQNQRRSWGEQVRERREALGLTLAQLSDLTGGALRVQTLSKIERGEIEPREYLRTALAVALTTEVADLFPPTQRSNALRLLRAAA